MIIAALLLIAVSMAQAESTPHTLSWRAAVQVHGKIQSGDLPESTKFSDETECIAFGKQMAPRVADWVRGMFQLNWGAPVAVRFECKPSGDPA